METFQLSSIVVRISAFLVLFRGICCLYQTTPTFKVAVVIDALSEQHLNQAVIDVKEAADQVLNVERPAGHVRLTYEIVRALPERSGASALGAKRNQNPLRIASKKVCREIMNGSLAVVLVHAMADKNLASAISYALGFYKVPVISVTSRDIEFSDKSVHSTFLRTVPPWRQQAAVWFHLLEKLAYQRIILIYPDEPNAAALVAYFRELIDNTPIGIELSIEYRLDDFNRSHVFDQIAESDCNVILLYVTSENAFGFFNEYRERFIASSRDTNRRRVLIANELALKPKNAPVGLLAVCLENGFESYKRSNNEHIVRKVSLIESLRTLKIAVQRWYDWTTSKNASAKPPDKCDSVHESQSFVSQWNEDLGPNLYRIILSTHYETEQNVMVGFDEVGDRIGAPYVIVNVQERDLYDNDNLAIVGRFVHRSDDFSGLILNESEIVWGENWHEKPKGITLKTHLIVGTVADAPFVFVDETSDPSQCHLRREGSPWRRCSRYNKTLQQAINYCCRGLCIELLDYLSSNNYTKFTYELRLSSDGYYGEQKLDGHWTGLMGELIRDEIDMSVAAMTINPERDAVIDFSKPWLYHGITILEKTKTRSSPMRSFLQPFQWQLWLCICITATVVGVILYVLDKWSPFTRYSTINEQGRDDDEERPLGFSGAMWFVWGVLLDSGIGERTPRGLSARVLGMFWCGFCMIIMASYTANLAAFLVLDQPEKSLTGINDIRLRNPTSNFTFATMKNTNVHMFFKRHVELSTIARTMEGHNYDNAQEAVDDVKSGKLDAFIWDSTYLEYVAANYCGLQTSGLLFGRAGYGIGLPKGSHWTPTITLAVLNAHESGYMQQLESTYVSGSSALPCEKIDNAPVRLGLKDMRDLFVLLGGGIGVGFCFVLGEILCKSRRKQRRRQLALQYGKIWRDRSRATSECDNELTQVAPPRRSFQPLLLRRVTSISAAARSQPLERRVLSQLPLRNGWSPRDVCTTSIDNDDDDDDNNCDGDGDGDGDGDRYDDRLPRTSRDRDQAVWLRFSALTSDLVGPSSTSDVTSASVLRKTPSTSTSVIGGDATSATTTTQALPRRVRRAILV